MQYDEAAMSLRYIIEHADIKVLPVGNLSATLNVRSRLPTAARIVEWKSRFYRAFPGGNPPEQFTDEVAVEAVSALFKSGARRVEGETRARVSLAARRFGRCRWLGGVARRPTRPLSPIRAAAISPSSISRR